MSTSTMTPIAQAHENDHCCSSHSSAPGFLPHWMQEHWTIILLVLSALFLLLAWLGTKYLGFSPQITLFFYILACVSAGYDVATHALPALMRGTFDTDVLMLAAAGGAAILGQWQEAAVLLFLFALGHAGEHYALDRARNAVHALGELMPRVAHIRRGEHIQELPIEQVQIGDVVLVRPGDRMPVDGSVLRGISAVDQSPITGESMPVTKQPGDQVFAGSINQDAALDVHTTTLARDNTLSRVMQLVAEAQSQHSPTQQLTQRFTRYFVPAVLISAILLTILPALLGWMSLSDSFYRAMLLLVAASPCALALGTPAAVMAGIAQAARHGVLIKGGVHLENLGALRAIAFDKTGTLTRGHYVVTDILPLEGVQPTELLAIAAAVEQHSNHPLARAVVQAARERSLALPAAEGLDNIPGQGVRSRIAGQDVQLGTLRLFTETEDGSLPASISPLVEHLEAAGRSSMIVRQGQRFLGVLGMADTLRPELPTILKRLHTSGIRHMVMLTGDKPGVAARIGHELGLNDIRAELLPEDKLHAIKDLQREYGSIAMLGDGINDAPALAAATVGVAMGGAGTAVALESADVALMGDDLSKLPFAVGLSRASRAIIQQNLAIALGVILLLLVTSVFGMLQLSWAVVLHEGSTLLVVINALRLLGYRFE